ncbi:MAG: ShlB/FhaC/HecB family hemolysin secretion/activation protein [Gammaproteobacteria bacterium]|nr:ShlB/FhaC/HecB family hemolysin secretion/activation protein [Gammaproteobacteria bacterium]
MIHSHRILFTGLSGLLLLPSAQAQPPDAGALQQQQQQQTQRERERRLPQAQAPDAPAPLMPTAPGDVQVEVKSFRFIGNSLLTDAQLQPAVAPFSNRALDFAQLQAAAMAVAQVYRAAGWVVNAYLPAQDIVNGQVSIQIVEARFGKLIAEGEISRMPQARALAPFTARQQPGDFLNSQKLDRALLIADDLPGVTLSASLRPGEQEQETDVLIKLADEPLLMGDASLDNHGARSTGEERLNLSTILNSPLGLGDRLVANFTHTQGSDYLQLLFNLPVGNDGWRLGASASIMDYDLITPEFRALDGYGRSSTLGLESLYPLIRSRQQNLYFYANLERKDFSNDANQARTSDYRVDNLGLSLFGNHFDNFGGGGANSGNLNLVFGRVDLDGSPNQALDAAGADTQGSFTKLRYQFSRQQAITPDLSLFGAWSGQQASKNLDSAEKFYLGGAYGVRAYPANEGAGSEAQMVNLELRQQLPKGFNLAAFYDWGQVTQNVDDAFAGAPNPNRYELKGYGLSLSWQTPLGLNLNATWARRDGDNPNADPLTGRDQDGSLDRDRIWLSASIPF